MIDEKVIKLQHFFEVDMRIKKEIISIAPPDEKQFMSESNIRRYINSIDDALIYIFSELKCITSDIFGVDSIIMQKIIELEKTIKKDYYSCGYNIDRLKIFYRNCISNMEKKFVDLIKEECVGYINGAYIYESMYSLRKASTINEILHFIHSCVLNNEAILKSIPIINEKTNDYKYPIRLRGYDVPIFEQLFEAFPNNLNVGWTDIVVVDERKLLMMVRDRGHALTIEITLNSQTARVEYFIPKLCNIDMINKLPGVNKVNEESSGATGIFEISVSDLSNRLFDFISKVPMDKDIVSETKRRF